ncbi:MAG: hypothetical protein Ct9H300mP31_19290 [Acidimicrobiaceae bacterium]|nr:MAG: hypothetical protein Ct9H300mP31_19290 [Acidimicrobiaceae bacterium]
MTPFVPEARCPGSSGCICIPETSVAPSCRWTRPTTGGLALGRPQLAGPSTDGMVSGIVAVEIQAVTRAMAGRWGEVLGRRTGERW